MKTEWPEIKLLGQKEWLEDQCYVDGNDGWRVQTLWQAAEDLPIYEVPLIGLRTDQSTWFDGGKVKFTDFLMHCDKVMKANLKYPILLTPEGGIADGRHRLGKAIIKGHTTIKIKRFVSMPEPDLIFDEDGDYEELSKSSE
jgi:hypothetical protein